REVDAPALGEPGEFVDLVGPDRQTRRVTGDAGVAWRRVEGREPRASRELPRERVLAAAATDDQDPHRRAAGSDAPRPGDARPARRRRPYTRPEASLIVHQLQMRARDARPGALGVELQVAPPVPRGLAASARLAEHAGEVEVGVRVVGRELERPQVVPDRGGQLTEILAERAGVVGGLGAARLRPEGRPV